MVPVKRSKIRWEYENWKRWVFNWRRKVCNDDDKTTDSGLWQTVPDLSCGNRKARLPTVDSLMGGATRRLVLTDRKARRPEGHRRRQEVSDIAVRCRESTSNVSTAILYCTRSGTRSQCSVANASEMPRLRACHTFAPVNSTLNC